MPKTTPVIIKSREELLSDVSNLSLEKIESAADGVIKLEILEERLLKEADKIDSSKLKICFLLLQISDFELWTFGDGIVYSFSEYVESTFCISRSTLNECLLVARRFGLYTEVEETVKMKGYCTVVTKYAPQYKLNPNYKGYGFKQLYLMRNLSDEEIETIGIKHEMSCRDIQKSIKNYKDGLANKDSDMEKISDSNTTAENEKEDDTSSLEDSIKYDDYYPSLIRKNNKVLVELKEIFIKPLKLPELPDGYDYVISLIDSKNICITKKKIQV